MQLFVVVFLSLFVGAVAILEQGNVCEDLRKVDKSTLRLPEHYAHFALPWVRYKNSQVYESPSLTANWNTVREFRVQGLEESFHSISEFLDESSCLWLIWGGSVRDLILGQSPTDIDATVTCNPHRLKRLCKMHFGEEKCNRPSRGSQKLVIGEWERVGDEKTVEPLDIAHWNTSFEVFASRWEFTPNTLSLYVDKSEEQERVLLIDVSGWGVEDVCEKRVRIPSWKRYWRSWSEENSVVKLYRFWKLRSRGFEAPDDEVNFIVQTTKEHFDSDMFAKFICHNVLGGELVHENECSVSRVSSSNAKLDFLDSMEKDFVAVGESTFFRENVMSSVENIVMT